MGAGRRMDADVSVDTTAILFFSEKLQYCSMRNTAVCAIPQYVQYQTLCKYVQYLQYSDVLRAPGRADVYPSTQIHPRTPRGLCGGLCTSPILT